MGRSKVKASISQLRSTSSGSRVRREGTIAMSSKPQARRPDLAMPISISTELLRKVASEWSEYQRCNSLRLAPPRNVGPAEPPYSCAMVAASVLFVISLFGIVGAINALRAAGEDRHPALRPWWFPAMLTAESVPLRVAIHAVLGRPADLGGRPGLPHRAHRALADARHVGHVRLSAIPGGPGKASDGRRPRRDGHLRFGFRPRRMGQGADDLPVPGPTDVERIDDIEYAPGLHLDVYRRRGLEPGLHPAILQIHGGSWRGGNRRQQGRPLLHRLAQQGWICVAASYPLVPEATFPGPADRSEASRGLDASVGTALRDRPRLRRGDRWLCGWAPSRPGGADAEPSRVPARLRKRRHQRPGRHPGVRHLRLPQPQPDARRVAHHSPRRDEGRQDGGRGPLSGSLSPRSDPRRRPAVPRDPRFTRFGGAGPRSRPVRCCAAGRVGGTGRLRRDPGRNPRLRCARLPALSLHDQRRCPVPRGHARIARPRPGRTTSPRIRRRQDRPRPAPAAGSPPPWCEHPGHPCSLRGPPRRR